ncbi:MAG: DUF3868 domain-containing protein [Butyricimonas faecihominis]
MGKQLVVSMQINVSRKLASNESFVLIPQLRDSLKNFMEFPRVYINGRRQHFVYLRNSKQFVQAGHLEVRRQDDSVQTNSIFTFRPLRGVDEPFCSFS